MTPPPVIPGLRRLGRWLRREQRLSADGEGFTLHTAGGPDVRIRWRDVERITAYKRDQLSTDLICLDFACVEGDGLYMVHEDLPGYEEMVRTLEATLPLLAGWWAEVAHPPFAPNATVIYQRTPDAPGPIAGDPPAA